MKILFVQTGGTIDKDYPKMMNGRGFEIGQPAFQRLLEDRLNASFRYEFHTVCQLDSSEITEDIRGKLLEEIDDRLEEAIEHGEGFDGVIITHGTDTMAETARFLGGSDFGDETRIIITGAMKPERFSNSDADCNLGMALAAVQTVPIGFVGICMHGRILKHDEIDRNTFTGMFHKKGEVEQPVGRTYSLNWADDVED